MQTSQPNEPRKPSRLCPDGSLTPEQEAAILADARAHFDAVGEAELVELCKQYERGELIPFEDILEMTDELFADLGRNNREDVA